MKVNSFQTTKKFILPWLCSGLIGLCLVGCEPKSPPTMLDKIKQEGVLHVVTRNSPVSYFEDRNGKTGFEYELTKRFAKRLGVELQIETVNTLDELYSKVANDKTPIIGAAGLIDNEQRSQQVTFTDPYLLVDTIVVYRQGNRIPSSVSDLLAKKILVIKGSSQADQLAKLKQQYPTLSYEESDAVDVIDLLQMVEDKKIDMTLVNSNELSMTQVYYPNVRPGFTLAKNQELSWIVAQGDDNSLVDAINEFFTEAKADGSLTGLADRFYGHVDVLGYVGAFSFAKNLQDRLPKYEPYFIQYGKKYKLDWKLIAAIGYQESHWNPDAVSPTGVRGLMMLTTNTAKAMGVANRLDAKQSIMGGAKLFANLKAEITEAIAEPDRTFFALAAYNMGQGHVKDAQQLAKLQKLDANIWRNVNGVLTLLSQKQWYQQTRYGYARGLEAKQFVRNVRRYYDILTWLDQSQRELTINKKQSLHIPALSRNDVSSSLATTETL